jgi:hypothetical protein
MASVATLVLSSCGGGEGDAAGEPTASPTPTSTVSVPQGLSMTDAGSALAFGDTATVVFEPTQKRGSVLELTVKKATKGSLKDFSAFVLDDYTRSATPYYVDVTVKNVGEGEVGGVPVPLWGVDQENTLLPAASFTTEFSRCASEPLPAKFAAGATLHTCLVFLAPDKGSMEAVSFRPTEEYDPIRWTGDITTLKPKPERAEGKKPGNKPRKNRQSR